MKKIVLLIVLTVFTQGFSKNPQVLLGVDVCFQEQKLAEWKGKRVGLVTNQSGVDREMRSTVDLFLASAPDVKLVSCAALAGRRAFSTDVSEAEDSLGRSISAMPAQAQPTRRATTTLAETLFAASVTALPPA